jgi:hypothetical protein
VEIYQGASISGAPFRSLSADPDDASGFYSAAPATPLPNGVYAARTTQTDTAGNTGTSNVVAFGVNVSAPPPAPDPGLSPGPKTPGDGAAPDTTLLSGPFEKTRDRTPTFTFASNEPNGTFECSVDGAAFVACVSPFTLPKLSRGEHTLSVRAIDQDGMVDPSPASATFDVKKDKKRKRR